MEETDHRRDKAPLLNSGSKQVLANLRVDIIFFMRNSYCGTFGLQGVCNLVRTQAILSHKETIQTLQVHGGNSGCFNESGRGCGTWFFLGCFAFPAFVGCSSFMRN